MAGLASILGGVAVLVLKPKPMPANTPPLKSFKNRAQLEIERINLEADIERAKINTITDVKRKELDRIEVTSSIDPERGRKELADWLAKNL